MNEYIFNFFKNVVLLVNLDVIKMFWLYAIWFLIVEFFIYTIEKLIFGVAKSVQWYDLVLLIFFTFVYALNTFTLVKIIKILGDK
jgi:hypothetical protein